MLYFTGEIVLLVTEFLEVLTLPVQLLRAGQPCVDAEVVEQILSMGWMGASAREVRAAEGPRAGRFEL